MWRNLPIVYSNYSVYFIRAINQSTLILARVHTYSYEYTDGATLPSKKKIINCFKGQCHEMDIFWRSCGGVPTHCSQPTFSPAPHVTYTRCFPHVDIDILALGSSLRCLWKLNYSFAPALNVYTSLAQSKLLFSTFCLYAAKIAALVSVKRVTGKIFKISK